MICEKCGKEGAQIMGLKKYHMDCYKQIIEEVKAEIAGEKK